MNNVVEYRVSVTVWFDQETDIWYAKISQTEYRRGQQAGGVVNVTINSSPGASHRRFMAQVRYHAKKAATELLS